MNVGLFDTRLPMHSDARPNPTCRQDLINFAFPQTKQPRHQDPMRAVQDHLAPFPISPGPRVYTEPPRRLPY
uniref:Uncharacterized protein n=1 Tax=mine drainage metagenome TaxID=410659 RepID=E6Q5P0_9ZZZZ